MNTSNYTHEAKVCPVKNQLYSPNTPNYVCEQMLAQLRTGFILAMKASYLLVSYCSLSLANTILLAMKAFYLLVSYCSLGLSLTILLLLSHFQSSTVCWN